MRRVAHVLFTLFFGVAALAMPAECCELGNDRVTVGADDCHADPCCSSETLATPTSRPDQRAVAGAVQVRFDVVPVAFRPAPAPAGFFSLPPFVALGDDARPRALGVVLRC